MSLIAPLANLAIGWTIVPLTALGWCSVLAGWAWISAGYIVAWPVWLMLEYLIRTVCFMSGIPFADVEF